MFSIDGSTRLYGIIGNPVSHSLSPRIHNAAFNSCKINAIYVPMAVEKADAVLKKSLVALPIHGVSVTIPHKVWAARSADVQDDLTRLCGAANTLYKKGTDGLLYGANTDGLGALRALRENVGNLRGRRVLLLGYGGSAAAIAHSLLLKENLSLLLVYGRNFSKCKRFAQHLAQTHPDQASQVVATQLKDVNSEDIDIIINTTPLGMQGQSAELPLPAHLIQAYHTVFDIVYVPARTPLLQLTAERKARSIPGYLMLLYQAVLQFELFSGQKAPVHLMERELLSALRQKR
ncbi:MAG: shikimate dehydrogenase [Leptospiraceae bacterium]|nr:shikimate dehydrogenase [Leptospiraceae bacterium]